MKRWEERIDVKAHADRIFDYVSDFTKHREWSGHGLQATKTSNGPVAVGSTYTTTAKQFGTQREHSTVTHLNPPSLFAWDSKGALGTVHHWFLLSPSGDVTTVSKGAELVRPTLLAK